MDQIPNILHGNGNVYQMNVLMTIHYASIFSSFDINIIGSVNDKLNRG